MSKQPQVLIFFETVNDELNNAVRKLNEKFTVFSLSLQENNFHELIAQNHVHVFITVGEKWTLFNSYFSKYGNKLVSRWIHKRNQEFIEQINTELLFNIINNVCFNSCITNVENKTISYFITAYNSGDLIYRPYNSLLSQTYGNWEMVVIDDSDDDNKITENIVKEIAKKDLRVKYFRGKHSGYIGEVKNYAARLCTGFVICEFDHDDEITPELTEELFNVYMKNPDVIFVSTDCCELYDDNQENHTYSEIYDFGYGSYSYEFKRGMWRAVSHAGDMNITTTKDIVGVPNHIRTWRASALFEIGYNNSELYIADDYELILRTIIYCANNDKRMLILPILGYYQYRNRKIGNHTFKRNSEIRKMQSLSNKYYKDKLLIALNILTSKYYPDKEKQKMFDNYNGNKCTPKWLMPYNWSPQNINPRYIPDNFKVSIVISTYNRKELLFDAINSILNQTYQNFEIIIIGNKCPVLNDFMLNEYTGDKSRIRWWNLLSKSKNDGVVSKNYALRNCVRTNLVCYLDDDNVYTPTHLETLVDCFKKDPEITFAFSSIQMAEYNIICREPKLFRIDTSTFMHKYSLLEKYGFWRHHDDVGYCHDFEIVSRWLNGDEKWMATEKVTMICNMETRSLNNSQKIYEAYDDQHENTEITYYSYE